jgi:protein involved in sex pheromone biosynthesis
MKKLLYILAATFMLASCCNCNENTEAESNIQSAKIENFCEVYKTKIENHTYILLSGYYRLALEHDPECPYCKEHGFPEHKLETTDY